MKAPGLLWPRLLYRIERSSISPRVTPFPSKGVATTNSCTAPFLRTANEFSSKPLLDRMVQYQRSPPCRSTPLGRLPLPSLKRTITSLLLPEPLPVVSLVCFPAPSTIVNCIFKCSCNVLYTRVELLPSMVEPVSASEFGEMHQEHRFFLVFFFSLFLASFYIPFPRLCYKLRPKCPGHLYRESVAFGGWEK